MSSWVKKYKKEESSDDDDLDFEDEDDDISSSVPSNSKPSGASRFQSMSDMKRNTAVAPIGAKASINIDQVIKLLCSDKVREIGL